MKIKAGFITQKMGDKTIVVSTGELCKTFHGMIELNRTGADIWNWLAEGQSEEQVTQKFAIKYKITEEKAKQDVRKLIEKMQENGIFEE